MSTEFDIVDAACNKCGSFNTHECSTDEIEFSPDNTGHYYVDMYCADCGNHFRACFNFTYHVTESWIRK